MRIGRKIALGRGVEIGEVAPPAARYPDFLAGRRIVVDDEHRPPAPARLNCAHHARRTRAEDHHIHLPHGVRLGRFRWRNNVIFCNCILRHAAALDKNPRSWGVAKW